MVTPNIFFQQSFFLTFIGMLTMLWFCYVMTIYHASQQKNCTILFLQ